MRRHAEKSETKKYVESVTGVHGWVIGYIYMNSDKDVFQRDLEAKFSIRRSTATGILQLMEKNELIKRIPVDYDARLKKLVLTDKAIELHQMVMADIDRAETLFRKGLTDEEIKSFFEITDKIKKNIENDN